MCPPPHLSIIILLDLPKWLIKYFKHKLFLTFSRQLKKKKNRNPTLLGPAMPLHLTHLLIIDFCLFIKFNF